MMMRAMALITFGLLIDALQAMVGWLFITLGAGIAVGAPVAGSIAGASITCVVGGALAGIATVASGGAAFPTIAAAAAACAAGGAAGAAIGGATGTVIGAAGIPLGIGVGFAISICISITLGAGFILLLWSFGMFYPLYVWSVFIGEAIPGLDIIPGWTFLAVRSILKKNAEEGGSANSFASVIASAVLSPTSATSGLGSIARGISNLKADTGARARSFPIGRQLYGEAPAQQSAPRRQELAADVRSRATPTINSDISTPRAAGDHQLHAKAA